MKSRRPVGTDSNTSKRLVAERLAPNDETIAAMEAARRGDFDGSFNDVDALLEVWRADDQAAK